MCVSSLLHLSHGNPRGEGEEAERSCALQVACQSLAAAGDGRGMFRAAALGSAVDILLPVPPLWSTGNSRRAPERVLPFGAASPSFLRRPLEPGRGSCGQQGAPAPARSRDGESGPAPLQPGRAPPLRVPAAPGGHGRPLRAASRSARSRGKPSGCARQCHGCPDRLSGSLPSPDGTKPWQPGLTSRLNLPRASS